MSTAPTMPSPISQDEINNILWKACDTFRGTVDPSQYKDYILVMLFVKYISDVHQDHFDEFMLKYKGDKTRVLRQLDKDKFKLPKGCTFPELYAQRNEPNLGEIINEALEAIEDANKEKLEGVFRNIDFNSEANLGRTKERNERLKNLLNDFNDKRLDLRPSRTSGRDVIGDAYEYLIGKFASGAGKKAGEFYTPPEVSELLAALVDPQPGERISDPACGSGSLLIKCAKHVGTDNYALYGQENNGSTWALAKMNMFLHDVTSARIEWGDTLNNPLLVENDKLMKFEVVVANPPFSLDKWGADGAEKDKYKRFFRGVPPKSYGDYAFITHMVESCHHISGRVGVIAPHGILFRGGAEGKIRQKLIEENLIDAVIGLPPGLFYGTSIHATIMLLKRKKKDNSVLLMDASAYFEQGNPQNVIKQEDINRIVQTYKNRKTIDKLSYLATYDEIKSKDYILHIPRYVDVYEPEPEVDIAKAQLEIESAERQIVQIQSTVKKYLVELGYGKK
jgi:type I restriction enzyme M protein